MRFTLITDPIPLSIDSGHSSNSNIYSSTLLYTPTMYLAIHTLAAVTYVLSASALPLPLPRPQDISEYHSSSPSLSTR